MYRNCDVTCNLNLKYTVHALYKNLFTMESDYNHSLMLSSEDFPSGATVGYAKSQIRDILKAEFNKSVELQVHLFV